MAADNITCLKNDYSALFITQHNHNINNIICVNKNNIYMTDIIIVERY